MAIKQLSIFVENKKGSLVEIYETLSHAKVDIRAMSIADTQDFGILRLIVSDSEKAAEALKQAHCIVSVTDVIGVAINDRAGSLAKVVRILTDNDVNIEYMYAFITVSKQFAYVVFRVADNDMATKLLQDNGVTMVTEEDIQNL
ncbi:MAG: ACT domain-containing protein [Clostridia bacterium]|nr:ACT domain-containing protein [Clostridia bacterium]